MRIRAETSDGRESIELQGTWSGDQQIYRHQALATYVAELLEGGSVIASTPGRVIGIAYQWIAKQTSDTLFLTRQPSVTEEMVAEFRVGDSSVIATHRPDQGVFEVDLTKLDVSPGGHPWTLVISNTEGASKSETYIGIGRFADPVTIGVSDSDLFVSRQEAITAAAEVARGSASDVGTYDGGRNGLKFRDSGTSGGTSGDTKGRFTTNGVEVAALPVHKFGPGIDRKLRIRNLASESSITFDPTGTA